MGVWVPILGVAKLVLFCLSLSEMTTFTSFPLVEERSFVVDGGETDLRRHPLLSSVSGSLTGGETGGY